MIDINIIAKNLVKEAVESTVSNQVKEGRPAGVRNLTFDGSVGSNADQLFLRYSRALRRKEEELDQLGNRIAILSSSMSNDEIDAAVKDPNSELFKLTQQYNELESATNSLESIMKKYTKEYQSNGGIYNDENDSFSGGSVSNATRDKLRNFDQDEKDRYNTDLYQKSLDKLRVALKRHGMDRNSFEPQGVNPEDPRMQKWIVDNEQSK